MPIFDLQCNRCGKIEEFLVQGETLPHCCEVPMVRLYTIGRHVDKYAPPLWVGRMDDIHKRQEQRGERFRMIQPGEVGAT